jgi:hypothetical protein
MTRPSASPAIHLVERHLRLDEALRRAVAGGRSHPGERPGAAPYVALSRQYGADGSAVGARVAELLGWTLYDRELLEEIAHDAHLQSRLLERFDERQRGDLEVWVTGLMSVDAVSEQDYTRALLRVLASLGRLGRAVIIGRGAHRVLPAEQGLRVRIMAPLDDRVAAVRRAEGLGEALARTKIDKIDRAREGWLRATFRDHLSTEDDLFDLELNSASLGPETCAELVVAALRAKCPAAARG